MFFPTYLSRDVLRELSRRRRQEEAMFSYTEIKPAWGGTPISRYPQKHSNRECAVVSRDEPDKIVCKFFGPNASNDAHAFCNLFGEEPKLSQEIAARQKQVEELKDTLHDLESKAAAVRKSLQELSPVEEVPWTEDMYLYGTDG